MKKGVFYVALLAISVLLSGCMVSQTTYDTLEQKYNNLEKENQQLQEKLDLYRSEKTGKPSVNTTGVNLSLEQEYAANLVKIYETNCAYYDSYLDWKVPGVEFKLKNEWNKDLWEVEVNVDFKDEAWNIIFSENYFPVNVDSRTDATDLKAGRIWQMERGKFYSSKKTPSEWKEWACDFSVKSVKFIK